MQLAKCRGNASTTPTGHKEVIAGLLSTAQKNEHLGHERRKQTHKVSDQTFVASQRDLFRFIWVLTFGIELSWEFLENDDNRMYFTR